MMTKLRLQCQYCGHVWAEYFNNKAEVEACACVKCGDKNLKVTPVDTDVYGYRKGAQKS